MTTELMQRCNILDSDTGHKLHVEVKNNHVYFISTHRDDKPLVVKMDPVRFNMFVSVAYFPSIDDPHATIHYRDNKPVTVLSLSVNPYSSDNPPFKTTLTMEGLTSNGRSMRFEFDNLHHFMGWVRNIDRIVSYLLKDNFDSDHYSVNHNL